MFQKLGMWIAMSTLQGGFGFPVLAPPLYQYMISGDASIPVSDEDIPDPGIYHVISLVRYN